MSIEKHGQYLRSKIESRLPRAARIPAALAINEHKARGLVRVAVKTQNARALAAIPPCDRKAAMNAPASS